MKKKFLAALVLFMIGMGPIVVGATTYTFTPYDNSGNNADIFDLDHNNIYFWSINWSLPPKETIKSATLTFKNISNWDNNPNWLKFSLLDNVKLSDTNNKIDIITIGDNQGTGVNNEIPKYKGLNFSDYIPLSVFSNIPGPKGTPIPLLSYEFDKTQLDTLGQYLDTVNTWASTAATRKKGQSTTITTYTTYESTFGIGIDPDCHFYNDGIELVITTVIDPPPVSTPEPTTMLLMGTGLIGLMGLRRKKNA